MATEQCKQEHVHTFTTIFRATVRGRRRPGGGAWPIKIKTCGCP